MKILPKGVQNWYLNLIEPMVKFFIRLEINPNHFTTFGFIIQVIAVYFLATGNFLIGGIFIWVSGTSDIIDGKIARSRKVGTKFGALYDSTLDRYAEFAIYFGFGFFFIKNEDYLFSAVTFIALGGSLMTSYIRARSEALNLFCKVGMMQRPERIVYLGGASIISSISWVAIIPIKIVLIMVAVFANITAVQRMKYVYYLTDKGRELMPTDPQKEEPSHSAERKKPDRDDTDE